MVLDTEWEKPAFDILRAAHAEYVVTDLHAAHDFYVGLLGFVVSYEDSGSLYLRGYEEIAHHSLVITKGPESRIGHLSFRVATEDDLDRLEHHFDSQGTTTRWIKEAEPGQGRALRLTDPLGFPVEYFCEMERCERLLQRYDLYRGAEVQRADHFNLFVPDVAAAYGYYKSLGFRCSEYTVTDPPDDDLWAAWMYRKPDVHDVALMNGDGPRLHHVGFWVGDRLSILRTCDLLASAGSVDAIERGPGRHGLSNAFFLYLRDPAGHRIELYTSDYYTGDPDLEPIRWSVNDPRRATFWGHAAPVSWFEEASPVAAEEGGTVALAPKKLAARPQTVT